MDLEYAQVSNYYYYCSNKSDEDKDNGKKYFLPIYLLVHHVCLCVVMLSNFDYLGTYFSFSTVFVPKEPSA